MTPPKTDELIRADSRGWRRMKTATNQGLKNGTISSRITAPITE
jgi:hypothetical protein